jgi:hypothetical protein
MIETAPLSERYRHNGPMRRSLGWLALLTFVATACTDAGETTTTSAAATVITTTTTAPPQWSTDADTAFFDAVQSPATIEWRRLDPGTGSDAPAFIHAISTATGEEAWRLEVPWPSFPWLQLAGDRLIYSYQNLGDEDVTVAVGLDGAPLWRQRRTGYSMARSSSKTKYWSVLPGLEVRTSVPGMPWWLSTSKTGGCSGKPGCAGRPRVASRAG